LNNAEERGDLMGIKVCQEAPSVNHLFFADDSLILFKINEQSTSHLQSVLSLHENFSGQMINKDKSSIMFSKNMTEEVRAAVLEALQISSEARNEKYLDLLIYMGKSKVQTFNYLKEKVWNRYRDGRKNYCLR
jgi:hypothetical protein